MSAPAEIECQCCRRSLPPEAFALDRTRPRGRQQWCRECKRNHWLRRLSPEELAALIEDQGHCCAVCGVRLEGGKGGMALDHDHATGMNRGVLCGPCNHREVAAADRVARFYPDASRPEAQHLAQQWPALAYVFRWRERHARALAPAETLPTLSEGCDTTTASCE